MELHDIVEQHAIFEGKPDFFPLSAALYLINHNSYGGTPSDLDDARESGELENPKRYRVRLTLEYEEIT